MRHGLGMMAALVMILTTCAAIRAAEETIEAQAHEYGAVYVRPAGSPEEVKAAKQEYRVHGNAMSMAINHKGVSRANVAVKRNGRVLLRNAGNVGSNSVVVGRRFADPVRVASKNKKKASGDNVVAAE